MHKILNLVAIGALLAVGPIQAFADIDTIYSIDTPNSDLSSCCTGPYATVNVHWLDNTHATVTFDSLTNGGYIYLMGAVNAADINVNALSWSIGNITGTNSITGFTPGPLSDDGSNNVSAFGTFNQSIRSDDGFTHTSTRITFDLVDISSTWSGSEKVLTPNGDGFSVAMHAFPCLLTCTNTTGAIDTGFAGTTYPSPIPEPEIYAMMGIGLALIGFVARRKRELQDRAAT